VQDRADPGRIDVTLRALGRFDPARALASPQERARAARLPAPARLRFLAGRDLLRRALSARLPRDPLDWRFRLGPHGAPSLDEDDPPLVFSLSHGETHAAVAIAGAGAVGVDVESVAEAPDLLALARPHFTSREAAQVGGLAGPARRRTFFAIWTLKEAYAKARGLGPALPTTDFGFDVAAAPPRLAEADVDPRDWSFLSLEPAPGAALALAARVPADAARARIAWLTPA
jgi:4'-phosphopantetheinyl transferase